MTCRRCIGRVGEIIATLYCVRRRYSSSRDRRTSNHANVALNNYFIERDTQDKH